MRTVADCTAATAPARRIVSSPSALASPEPIQLLADKGRGWPAHSFRTFSARASEIKQRKDALPAGLGKTLTEASSMSAKVPKEPGNKRETS